MQQVGAYETLHFSCAALIWETWKTFNTFTFTSHNLWDETDYVARETHLICEIINSVQTGMCHEHEVNKGLVFHLTHGEDAFIQTCVCPSLKCFLQTIRHLI